MHQVENARKDITNKQFKTCFRVNTVVHMSLFIISKVLLNAL